MSSVQLQQDRPTSDPPWTTPWPTWWPTISPLWCRTVSAPGTPTLGTLKACWVSNAWRSSQFYRMSETTQSFTYTVYHLKKKHMVPHPPVAPDLPFSGLSWCFQMSPSCWIRCLWWWEPPSPLTSTWQPFRRLNFSRCLFEAPQHSKTDIQQLAH